MAPADENECRQMLYTATTLAGPVGGALSARPGSGRRAGRGDDGAAGGQGADPPRGLERPADPRVRRAGEVRPRSSASASTPPSSTCASSNRSTKSWCCASRRTHTRAGHHRRKRGGRRRRLRGHRAARELRDMRCPRSRSAFPTGSSNTARAKTAWRPGGARSRQPGGRGPALVGTRSAVARLSRSGT